MRHEKADNYEVGNLNSYYPGCSREYLKVSLRHDVFAIAYLSDVELVDQRT